MSQGKPKGPAMRTIIALLIFAGLVLGLFILDPVSLYPWVKAFHIIAVICWMAGMLYLPRLFVYHTGAEPGSQLSEIFKMMERRLLRIIINPAMIATWVLGLWMAWRGFGFSGGWIHAKITAVLLLSAVHGYLSASVRRFEQDRNTKSARHWRIVNEVPAILMVIAVILVVIKPF